jgi:tetratricopeptide (TPR) repeat protein
MTTVSLTLSQVFEFALKAYHAGKLIEAEQLCLKILSADPDSAPTLNLLAVINSALGRNDAALSNYDRALSLRPDFVEALSNRGATLKAMKRLEEALESYDRALALKPDHVQVLNNRASVLHDMKQYDEALTSYDRALAVRPDYAEALSNRGITLQALGRHDQALISYDAALSLRPDFVEALVNRGITLFELKRFDDALANYDRAIALRPSNADALVNRGNALGKLQRHSEAVASFDAALTLHPDHVEALIGRGVAQHDLRQYDEALKSYSRALARRPDHAGVLVNRGVTLHELQRAAEALDSYDCALALDPDHAEALTNRGVALHDLERYGEALASQDQALAVQPDHAAALSNRGVTLHKLGRLDEALASYDRALASRPDYAEALVNRGVTLNNLKRFDEAVTSYDRAIALRPDDADAHFFRSMTRLLAGDFSDGWIEHEWRKKTSTGSSKRVFSQPPWLGGDEIAGKTILLHSEQGFGDTIQFCRYVRLVAARGARVVLEVEEPLQGLLTGLAGVDRVVAKGDSLPDFELQCSLLSLPLAFKTRLETIPSAVPYLRAPDRALLKWGARLPRTSRLRIGIAWAGNAKHIRDRERSIDLGDLLPLLDVGATFVSLQKEVRAADMAILNSNPGILHFGHEITHFTDTAALISHLDLVISVDTGVAHLAGALGRPVWILLTHVPDWRWLLDRNDSPWYPTARLFRQDGGREWASVITRIRDALLSLGEGHQKIE